jgi:hypothetical protein
MRVTVGALTLCTSFSGIGNSSHSRPAHRTAASGGAEPSTASTATTISRARALFLFGVPFGHGRRLFRPLRQARDQPKRPQM